MKTILLLLTFALGLLGAEPTSFVVQVEGKGTPMILIPGLSSAGEVWKGTVDHYRSRFECHVLTLAGFAGVPALEGPFLQRVRDDVAAYIRTKKLGKPVIVGHSLGGFLALDIAGKYPDLVRSAVIVDAYPFLPAVMMPTATREQALQYADMIRKQMSAQGQEDYERYVKSGVSTRAMVSKDADFETVTEWGLKSDRKAVMEALVEMMTTDLRPELEAIRAPVLVLGSWAGYKQYTTPEKTMANLMAQYEKLEGVEIALSESGRHFLMWDDAPWMFAEMDRFLGKDK